MIRCDRGLNKFLRDPVNSNSYTVVERTTTRLKHSI
jgi:hypothetical protein